MNSKAQSKYKVILILRIVRKMEKKRKTTKNRKTTKKRKTSRRKKKRFPVRIIYGILR
jgi:hypothetical protein